MPWEEDEDEGGLRARIIAKIFPVEENVQRKQTKNDMESCTGVRQELGGEEVVPNWCFLYYNSSTRRTEEALALNFKMIDLSLTTIVYHEV